MVEDKEEDGYDAIVVGSGYGGSVAACRIAMAGIKVCLLEKGKRWESKDFPTNTMKFMSNVRMESHGSRVVFGPKDALFQVHEQGDSAAVVACGLGGGSLINAGVILPTPVRAKRNPKWPKEWTVDWDVYESSAAAMLKVQSVPVKFPVGKVMEKISEGEMEQTSESLLKLSVNFDIEESQSSSPKLRQSGSCLACGNCLTGCPYNAKSSTDKNYIVTAIQAGCTMRTGCQAQYVVENLDEMSPEQGRITRQRRRWRIYLNEIDFIMSDFIILSAGVLGTTEILFQSRMRGLKLSGALGSGFSTNGNTVAYVAGSPAPLNGYGLDEKQFLKTPFEHRPGPSITSSHTFSLGFTIQTAILPTAYPLLVFKGIKSYGWPIGHWFLHGIIDELKHVLGIKSSQAIALNAIGYDASNGRVTLDKKTERMCFTAPHDPLLPRKVEAFQKLTKKLGGFLFLPRYRSVAVHLLGGCNASSDSSSGVCNHHGQVFDPKSPANVHEGLYVCDASLIPCSIGVNPALTIAAVAEHVSAHLVQDILKYRSSRAAEPDVTNVKHNQCSSDDYCHNPTVRIKETLRGYVGGFPCIVYLKIKMNSQNQTMCDDTKASNPSLRGEVGGYVVCRSLEKDKLHVISGNVDLCALDHRTPFTQYMRYRLLLAASSGSRYVLKGKKILNPFFFGMYAWRETTTLHITIKEAAANMSKDTRLKLKGQLRVPLFELLKNVMSLGGNNIGRFMCTFLHNLARTYIFQIPRGSHADLVPFGSCFKSYPSSFFHELKTDDGCFVSCRHWKCDRDQRTFKEEMHLYPVLLLNGYSTESYFLPTEPHDLVRTLLYKGHDVWLLQSRLHPLNPANDFTIEDIAKFDVPSAIRKILELCGPSTRVHVVAHCVGGLAIHMALMGGHISATDIASLTCTNSAMFFKLTSFAAAKMWIPLVQVSMAILGQNKILPLRETKNTSSWHRLLKCVARWMPRYERCTCKECDVFSGIFGNTFWHQNVSTTMHHWLNDVSSTRLPMSAFPHLRKVCNSGFIVDSKGKNTYLSHPERMALSTMYISGGRSILVTPETSFLANKYMKLHQPSFRHERVVVDGFGHSDLLIGEKSYKKVFPHIVSHIRSAELDGKDRRSHAEKKKKNYNREALEWGDDPFGEEYRGTPTWFSPQIFAMLLLSFVLALMWQMV